ncbi:MAG: hypothetical protein Q7R78_00975 [bacterium]|nr:hypothetical protein [bacterium]
MPTPESPFIIPKEEFEKGLANGDYVVLTPEEEAKLREEHGLDKDGKPKRKEKNKKDQAESINFEEIKEKYSPFLKQTFKIWGVSQDTLDITNFTPEIINPKDLDYEAKKSDIDTTKFGQYTVNPDTQNINFENLDESKIFIPDLSLLNGKPLSEVAEYLKTTCGDRYHIPGIEYWQYLIDNPTEIPEKLKDGKYYFNFGSLVRRSGGLWNVPCAIWDGSKWDRNGRWLSFTWNSYYRVLLLEI